MSVLINILYFLIFPGFLFTAVMGLLSTWVDRKVTARIHYRVGPPWYQPFADVLKLMGKELIIPEGASKIMYLGAPLLGLAAVTLVSTILWLVNLNLGTSFIGDLIVVVYLLTLPSLAVILGGFASRNPLATLGASREMKLILAYEVPFILVILIPVIKAGSLLFGNMIAYQGGTAVFLSSASGFIGFLVTLFVAQAKLGYIPFDIAEAEQEIMAGPFIEYSGAAFALQKLTRAMLLFTLPVLMITLFMGGIDVSSWRGIIYFIIKYVIILVLIVVIKNTNPRLRIDQALRFFWGPVAVLAAVGVVLALIGF